MKFFHSIERNFGVLGLIWSESGKENHRINSKIVHILFILGLVIGSCVAHFFIGANDFQAYAICVYVSSTFLVGAVVYAICAWENPQISAMIDTAEKIMNASEFIPWFV